MQEAAAKVGAGGRQHANTVYAAPNPGAPEANILGGNEEGEPLTGGDNNLAG
jgi:hypothetical protein